ncbi:hypothetical protein JW865_04190 [Candidatus Bathyarchaeota archaeon]|nr:hypothetical protein [Candidatus Bathyarchaeota archaeon]
MVEYELIQTLQSISYIAGALGVCIAATYYLIALRNTEKIKRRDLVFQRLNVNMIEHYRILGEVMNIRDWNTFEEFSKRYSLVSNFEVFAKISYVINHYNCLGILMKDGIIKAEEVFQLYQPNAAYAIYTLYEPYIISQRMNRRLEPTCPENFKGFEYLYHEIKRRYPNMTGLRDWTTPSTELSKWDTTWDEVFMKNPQLLENPLPAMKKK